MSTIMNVPIIRICSRLFSIFTHAMSASAVQNHDSASGSTHPPTPPKESRVAKEAEVVEKLNMANFEGWDAYSYGC